MCEVAAFPHYRNTLEDDLVALNYLVEVCAPSTALLKEWTVDLDSYGYHSLKHI